MVRSAFRARTIRLLNGKPLIAYSIETALNSGLFDLVVVSTDDTEIAQIAKEYGACVPFMRPADLADHMTGTTPVMRHALQELMLQGYQPSEACLIYATCPLLTADDLQKGWQQLPGEGFSFSATTFGFPIQRALCLNEQGELAPMFPEHIKKRSQDLQEAIHDAGQFYWAKTDTWLDNKEIFGPHSHPIMLPRHRIQDLDTEEDWLRLTQIMLLKQASDLNL